MQNTVVTRVPTFIFSKKTLSVTLKYEIAYNQQSLRTFTTGQDYHSYFKTKPLWEDGARPREDIL